MFESLILLLKKAFFKDHKPLIRTVNNNSSNIVPRKKVLKPIVTTKRKVINKDFLANKIKKNIFFLDELLNLINKKDEYAEYAYKVVDLKEQSEASFKILFRLKEEKPYYQTTLAALLKHTLIIAELLEN